MERVVSAVAQFFEERHAALRDGVFQLAAGESVDLDEQKAGLLAFALDGSEAEMADGPFAAAEAAPPAVEFGFEVGEHGSGDHCVSDD